ncbi:uncharacterized protein LOC110029609 isoform X2 [Phalaenopsis equestris]|uniref:uncharacterized protein LOC110029609 isoform X1 n=1 Tax=Phalaenopsis equestris TaxID=78828 RepID=UPI0009E46E0C|nr:uncharacterized protein LOC110029609 isoform X1 [Phalaenopsis equestris]XP_020587636.1 uncharacterized protein LOC110029609 isoform X2 [Phalaenopsis equestris]
MNDQSQRMNLSYAMWRAQAQAPVPLVLAPVVEEPMGFQKPRRVFGPTGAKPRRMNWNKRKKPKAGTAAVMGASLVDPCVVSTAGVSGYNPPNLKELQYQNRVKARRFYPKKKFSRFVPFAPRNTTSFIIRAKQSGGIASIVSPYAVTPAILPTPKFSPSGERLVDMAKEEWGVDGYGTMKGLIRLRSPTSGVGNVGIVGAEEDEEDDDGPGDSDVEEHVEVERRLDHDLSRFEIVYPSHGEDHGVATTTTTYLLENRVEYQDIHIAQLEEENLTLKERLSLMERNMEELKVKLQMLESDFRPRNENDNHDSNAHHAEGMNLNISEENSENDGGHYSCSEKSAGNYEESSGDRIQRRR